MMTSEIHQSESLNKVQVSGTDSERHEMINRSIQRKSERSMKQVKEGSGELWENGIPRKQKVYI